MAQRLVRRLCRHCAEEYAPSEAELRGLDLDPRLFAGRTFRQPRGCPECERTGYRGRLGLFEVLELDETLREMTFRGASLEDVRATALATRRLRPLLADGARKVAAGQTTVSEVLRVTRAATASV
jgi:type II secretory ATPase GspE/PulE/Tfp pilus assembly ATPase PilB-like protein